VVAAVHNLSGEAKQTKLDFSEHGSRRIIDLLGDHAYEEVPDAEVLEMEPYGYRWFRLDAIRP
jgi:hypothetical protein